MEHIKSVKILFHFQVDNYFIYVNFYLVLKFLHYVSAGRVAYGSSELAASICRV
jgi:hypothetical protein